MSNPESVNRPSDTPAIEVYRSGDLFLVARDRAGWLVKKSGRIGHPAYAAPVSALMSHSSVSEPWVKLDISSNGSELDLPTGVAEVVASLRETSPRVGPAWDKNYDS